MKKLYNPLPTGGAPVHTETLNTTELEIYAALEGILSKLDPALAYPIKYQAAPSTNYVSTGIIVSGGGVTDNTTDWDLAAGIAYFPVAGRFARFAAEATIDNADYAMITLDSPAVTQKTFFDAANKNYYEEYAASVATLTPPAAEPVVEYVCVRKASYMEGTDMGHPTFGNIIGNLNAFVIAEEPTAMTPTSPWTNPSSFSTYRKIGERVHLNIAAGNSAAAGADVFATLPAAYRSYTENPGVGVAYGETTNNLYPVIVDPATGNISIVGASGITESKIRANFSFLGSVYNF